jgi:prepilin-type N-terminal cleavage/methylation domain-containing protein
MSERKLSWRTALCPVRIRPMRRGFTAVELMMALAIFSIGITGIVATEIVTARSNLHAKDLAVATQFARSWEERLAMDGILWGGPNSWLLDNTTWLDGVVTNNAEWVLPAASGNFGPGAGARGEFVAAADAYFCAHIRLTRLIDRTGSGLIRTEVRVFWPKGPAAWSNGDPYCVAAANLTPIMALDDVETEWFHFVYNSSVVRETPKF